MKKTLMILGGVFVALVAIAVITFAILARKGNGLDKESKVYADTAIPAIVSEWDIIELQRRASPEFKALMKEGDWRSYSMPLNE